MRRLLLILAVFSATFTDAQELRPQDVYKRILPSIVTLHVQKQDGTIASGTAFMALKDGLAVTAWHVVSDASVVVAKFSNGEEFEASGLVDKDERRDVAIIRVKVSGRPILSLATNEPDIGSNVYAVGAPKGFEFTISDGLLSQIQIVDGIKQYQFSCPASSGNSGGPLVNARGLVIGVVSWQIRDGQNLNFAVPSTFVLGLDITLPTQPWASVQHSTPLSSMQTSGDDLDAALGSYCTSINDLETAIQVTSALVHEPGGFKRGIPSELYTAIQTIEDDASTLDKAASNDPDRNAVRLEVLKQAARYVECANLLIKAIRAAQGGGGWDADANDLFSRATAAHTLGNNVFTPQSKPGWDKLRTSARFTNSIDRASQYQLGLLPDSAGFRLGVYVYSGNSLYLAVVSEGGLASELGLRSGDAVYSANGKPFAILQDFKMVLSKYAGKTLTVVLDRYNSSRGKWEQEELEMDVPRNLSRWR
jgi:S1-C subfamily serine protease